MLTYFCKSSKRIVDTVGLKFIPFGLEDDAEKWMYGLPTNTITNWEGFVRGFLWKYFPNNKIVKLKNKINNSCKLIGSHFRTLLIGLRTFYLNVLTVV